jgi:ABC-type polysaccharide/polyol phosphate transport system ATPase subunit
MALDAVHVSKTFVVPHERRLRLKEYFAQPFRPRTFDYQDALRDVSLSVRHGECFGIIGRNGSGKSTLLKVLAGIYRADSGAVRVDGDISPFIELGVGFNPELSARDNIEINGSLLGLTQKQIAERFASILSFAELERFVDQQLKNYSSGMLMRLAYSIAVQVPFDILLLDEVLAVGDVSFQEKCFETFRQMRVAQKTIVFVSHNLEAIREHCDRVLLLEDGKCLGIGDPKDVVAQYLEREHAGTVDIPDVVSSTGE